MLSKFFSFALVLLIANFSLVSVSYGKVGTDKLSKNEKKIQKRALEIKEGVAKLGTGQDSLVEVKLRDKRRISGHISKIGTDSFTVVDANGSPTVVKYSEAKQAKGKNMSSGAWFAVGFGLAMLVFVVAVVLISMRN